jgi:hypothetical protein
MAQWLNWIMAQLPSGNALTALGLVLFTALGFLVTQVFSANIRKFLQDKGWNNLLIRFLSFLWADWETTRKRWWLWFLMGATGGLVATLGYFALHPTPEAIAVPYVNPLHDARAKWELAEHLSLAVRRSVVK